jgi:hypothetical protein
VPPHDPVISATVLSVSSQWDFDLHLTFLFQVRPGIISKDMPTHNITGTEE